MVSGCGMEINAHFKRAALLKYQPNPTPTSPLDTWHDIPPSHIIFDNEVTTSDS